MSKLSKTEAWTEVVAGFVWEKTVQPVVLLTKTAAELLAAKVPSLQIERSLLNDWPI